MRDIPPTNDYRLFGITPATIATPETAEDLAAVLGEATRTGAAVVPWGAGTRQHIGRPPARYDIALATTNLNRIVAYNPADMVVTVEAGARLGAVQAELQKHNQWLPWDPPLDEQATVGGLLATAASGSLRLGYCAPREWVLGMRVALGDGRLVKSGAQVVKNVAGYDTHKLHIGASGTLGIIVEVTFKLAPLPAYSRTLLVSFTNPEQAVVALENLRQAPLSPISLVVLNDLAGQLTPALAHFQENQPRHLTIAARFAGVQRAVERQLREASQRSAELGARCIDLTNQESMLFWRLVADFSAPGDPETLLLRVGAPPSRLGKLAETFEMVTRSRGWIAARLFYAGVGLGFGRWWPPPGTEPAAIAATLAELRTRLAGLGGYVVVEQAPEQLRTTLDLWGPPPATLPLVQALRAKWDPAGVVNPGRGFAF